MTRTTLTTLAAAFGALALALATTACSATGKPEEPGGEGGSGGKGTGGTAGIFLGTGGGNSSGPGEGCAYAEVQGTLIPANILFLVDRSGSMNCNLPPMQSSGDCEANPLAVDATQPSKWTVIRSVLKDTFATLPTGALAGLTYFNNDDQCGVQSTPNVGLALADQTQIDALGFSLDGVEPKGGTPIVGATILAFKHLHQQAQIWGNGFVVVLTDGADTCNGDALQQLFDVEIPNARSVNIRTFAIGAPGSEPGRAVLSRIAWEGGTARSPDCDHSGAAPDAGNCHYDMTTSTDFATDLAAALAQISGTALSCELDVPLSTDGSPVDYSKVNVDYYAGGGPDRTPILKDDSAPCDAGASGWQYSDDQAKIRLCGPACGAVQGDQGGKIQIVLGCETVVK